MKRTEDIRERNHCSTCKRQSTTRDGCAVFNPEPENCWAWTDDPDWLGKVNKATTEYSDIHDEEYRQHPKEMGA
jgi:hypothetical protein